MYPVAGPSFQNPAVGADQADGPSVRRVGVEVDVELVVGWRRLGPRDLLAVVGHDLLGLGLSHRLGQLLAVATSIRGLPRRRTMV